MTKIYARIVSHPSGNLTFQVKGSDSNMWADKQRGFITKPADNADFMTRVSDDLKFYIKSGIEVIWLP